MYANRLKKFALSKCFTIRYTPDTSLFGKLRELAYICKL